MPKSKSRGNREAKKPKQKKAAPPPPSTVEHAFIEPTPTRPSKKKAGR